MQGDGRLERAHRDTNFPFWASSLSLPLVQVLVGQTIRLLSVCMHVCLCVIRMLSCVILLARPFSSQQYHPEFSIIWFKS